MKKFWLILVRHRKVLLGILIWVILIGAVSWAGKGLFKYRFYSTHDLDHHLARSYNAIQTFAEGQFPLRWAGNMNYGCGVPVFNFFYPLLYYLVIIFNAFIKDIFLIFKLVSLGSLLIGTLFFYLWAKKETGDKRASLAGAILYLYAPYRFLLVYVRGSPEYLAYAIWPVVLYFFCLAFRERRIKKFVLLCFLSALTGGLLTISHNFTVMFLMPILLLYLIVKFLFGERLEKKRIFLLLFSYLSAFGLGAFFIFPALLEEKFTKLPIPAFVYSDHFPELWQVIHSKWDYFYSFPGIADDRMSFELGYAHWAILGLVGLWLVMRLILLIFKKQAVRDFLRNNIWVIVFFALSIFTFFLTLPYSRFIWDKIPLLQAIQFPWRLLGVDVLAISMVFVYWLTKVKSKFFYWSFLIGISLLAFIGNRNHLLSEPVMDDMVKYYEFPETDLNRYSLGKIGHDVLPASMEGTCLPTDKFVRSSSDKGDIEYKVIEKKSIQGSVAFSIDNKTNSNNEKIIINLSYFPGIYKFSVNGQKMDYQDCNGRVCFPRGSLRQGENFVSWKVGQSKIESIFNYVTLAFLAIWGLILLFSQTKYKPKVWHAVLLLIFITFAFLRFYNLDHRIGFSWDQERDAWAVKDILNGDLKFIGPRVLGPEGFYLPPYFYYILAPFYLFAGGSPFAIIYFLIFYGISFFLVSLFVFKKLFGNKIALIFLALWAVNPPTVIMDKWLWNPTLIPIATVCLFYLLYLYDLKKNNILLLLTGVLFGLGFSFHVQFLLLFPILLAFIRWGKRVLFVVFGFLITFTPIIIFDLKNNFLNFRLALGFITKGAPKDLGAFLPVFDRFFFGLSGIHGVKFISVAFYLVFLIIFYLILKRHKLTSFQNKLFKGFLFAWIAVPIFFAYYGARPSEYYFNYLIPIIFLTFSFLLSKLKLWILIIFGLIILFFWGRKSYENTENNSLSLYYKAKAVQFLGMATKKEDLPFNVSFDVPLDEDAGFRYFLDFYKVKYTGNPKDTLVEFVIPPDRKKSSYPIGGIGVYIPDGFFKR